MEKFVIEGGKPLSGSIRVQGAKNAALPILAATVLSEGVHRIYDVPDLTDVRAMCQILVALGAKVIRFPDHIEVDTTYIVHSHIPDDLMRKIRSSIFLLGPMLARLHQVSVSKPGGCAIGQRPIDIHLKGLEALGAQIEEQSEMIHCHVDRLIGTKIKLEFPSVGATENVMMAAVLAEGTTVIHNSAREPEIMDLQAVLNKMGARIHGAGTSTIYVEGVDQLNPVEHCIIPDRIVAGTLMAAVGATQGEVTLENVNRYHLASVIDILTDMGVKLDWEEDRVRVWTEQKLRPIHMIATEPFPGFPTDMQPQMLVLLTLADGTSQLAEKIFESRLKHVDELIKMGAKIKVDGCKACIDGPSELTGAHVAATDLRAGAALVIAGLCAKGTTVVEGVPYIDRGYDCFDEVIKSLGGQIYRKQTSPSFISNSSTV
ncbi:UDP-N-acetylglucosamine 1-carboxyvinyltransferase [Hazenella sp. IB182357]|uniref:UDP-N-acetylglucosamine 1-carboxyvinyltransferase n=1 Tax=Polycladospora coralii TaxID=2771432 RepID=A0A926RTL7_9BACL|nr:UDP-N-acetylglucosamine 1-carboxyvinyltransferase [Polycladospora coralii]MBD1371324.1 UDP-N-acetylglucosamine 1-carboxyvinyltransferase [Polycladospora coralii]MBS7530292.1 UDP-N-acetylglucosamine 1-carboxyvinyltransferase [Polycladospora coralii]